jgi:hypothetical protein
MAVVFNFAKSLLIVAAKDDDVLENCLLETVTCVSSADAIIVPSAHASNAPKRVASIKLRRWAIANAKPTDPGELECQ